MLLKVSLLLTESKWGCQSTSPFRPPNMKEEDDAIKPKLCPSAPSYSKAPAGVQQGCGRLPQKPLLELNVSVPSHGLPAPVGLDSLVRYPSREHCCCAAPAERVGGVAAVQARFCAKALEPSVEVGVVEVEDVGSRCW